MAALPAISCPICAGATQPAGQKKGTRTQRVFELRRCTACGHGFVTDPWVEYSKIYDIDYYEGRGSDPSVDYAHEFDHPADTVRRYEWRGIVDAVTALVPPPAKWLDYGCGNGGLVRYAKEKSRYDIAGFDTGAWAEKARANGLPILSPAELSTRQGAFDVVTAVEVIEHCVDPLAELRKLRGLLRRGGTLFLTTGNADSAPREFAKWSYVSPEIHVSYFTSRSLARALESSGFAPLQMTRLSGRSDILRFKILKKLRFRNCNVLERILPWPLLAPLGDRLARFSAMPLGRAI